MKDLLVHVSDFAIYARDILLREGGANKGRCGSCISCAGSFYDY
jgi:hypothetical protein